MERVLVTGASGFIGYHCIEPLQKTGFEVHCVSARGYQESLDNVVWHRADLLDSDSIQGLVSGVAPQRLLHMAWFVEPGKVINYPDNILWVEKSIELLRHFAANGGKRVVFCGSCYEYDWRYGYCNEEVTPTSPDTYYGISKNALREVFEKYCELQGVSGAWGRVFFLYGPRENEKRLVSSVILNLLNDKEAPSSHGRQVRDYMHVQDVAEGLVNLLNSELHGAYNICSGAMTSIRDIVTTIGELMGKRELIRIGALPARANDLPLVAGDPGKFHAATGWVPKYELRDGLQQTIDWWKKNQNQS